jgi:hypothetical protein
MDVMLIITHTYRRKNKGILVLKTNYLCYTQANALAKFVSKADNKST